MTSIVVLIICAWQTVHERSETGAVPLPRADYQNALRGARFVVGDENRRFCVIEFFDYECAPCRLIVPKVRAMVLSSQGKASLEVRNFPLRMHPHALQLAQIACVLDRTDFEAFDSKAIALEGKELDRLLDSWHEQLNKDHPAWLAEARVKLELENRLRAQLAVRSTPSFFVFDHLKGIMYKCPTLDAVRSVISSA